MTFREGDTAIKVFGYRGAKKRDEVGIRKIIYAETKERERETEAGEVKFLPSDFL